jgi:hypothetical protein
MTKPKKQKPTTKAIQKTPPKERVLTKDEFLKALKKATRPIPPKASPSKGKSKTLG